VAMLDVIVIGAGHNGLTAAAYLARAGRRVLVLEGRSIVGGYCTTEETVAEAPGFKMNPCALDCVMTNIPRSVVDELRLASYGLRFVNPDPWGAFVGPGGESIALWRDRRKTIAEIARFSRRDASAFDRFCTVMKDFWWAAAPYLQDHPRRPRARTIAEVAWRAGRGRRQLRQAVRMVISSPEQILEEWFERDEVKAFLANFASVSLLPVQEPGSGAVLGSAVIYAEFGINRPIGGSGRFTEAIADCVRAHGGEVRTDAGVEEVLVGSGGAAEGVRLRDGSELRARQVVGAVDPTTLMSGLVDRAHVPEPVRDELRALRTLKYNITNLKGDVALSGRPALACGRPELWNAFLLLAPTLDYVRGAQMSCAAGRLPEEIPMWVAMPSAIDRSQVPAGSDGETLYVYTPTVPMDLADGRTWDDEVKTEFHDRALGLLEGYAPGLREKVIGTWIKGPAELSKTVHRGHVIHVDISPSQLGPWRPTPSLAGYRTPVAGLWHCGAGAHPIGLLNGWSGRTTARLVDRELKA